MRAPKVRESSDPSERHEELPMPAAHRGDCSLNLVEPFSGLFPQKLEGQVEERLAHPGQLRRAVTQRSRRFGDLAPRGGRKINRQKESHGPLRSMIRQVR